MKTSFFVIGFFIFASLQPVFAESCKEAQLLVRETKAEPKSTLKRHFKKRSKQWFTQESRLQEPTKVNYDTSIVTPNSNGALVEILAQGHVREAAVETKWLDKQSLLVSVEWSRTLFCTYNVDVDKKTASLWVK